VLQRLLALVLGAGGLSLSTPASAQVAAPVTVDTTALEFLGLLRLALLAAEDDHE